MAYMDLVDFFNIFMAYMDLVDFSLHRTTLPKAPLPKTFSSSKLSIETFFSLQVKMSDSSFTPNVSFLETSNFSPNPSSFLTPSMHRIHWLKALHRNFFFVA